MKKYPDIGNILEAKEDQRRALAGLSFEKKIELVFKLTERRKFIKSGILVKKAESNAKSHKASDPSVN